MGSNEKGKVFVIKKVQTSHRRDEPFQVLFRMDDNAYNIELLGEYRVSATFNVTDLSLFDVGDGKITLRPHSLQEGGDDEYIEH